MLLTSEMVALPIRPSQIQAAAQARLRASSYSELHHLRCIHRDGVLTVKGCVSRYYLLQVALALLQEVDGVEAIDNRIAVLSHAPRQEGHAV